jgi:hypothetical protein
VAVNPTNPNNVVAAWIQDYASGIVAGVTFDSGVGRPGFGSTVG